jgi:hypothetical protein
MSITVRCITYFDITATGVRSHYKSSRMPFIDTAGNSICTELDWQRSRNQQRNWETVNQIISLRTLPENITVPVIVDHQHRRTWQFDFEISQAESLTVMDDPVGALVNDSLDVPMITGLDEDPATDARLLPGVNVFFTVVDHK